MPRSIGTACQVTLRANTHRLPLGESLSSYRAQLLDSVAYAAHPFFLAHTTWFYRSKTGFELAEPPNLTPVKIIVVGQLSQDPALISPLSVIDSSMYLTSPSDMHVTFRLQAPATDDNLRTDFSCAWHNLHNLLLSSPFRNKRLPDLYRSEPTCQLNPNTITFTIPLFHRKVTSPQQ